MTSGAKLASWARLFAEYAGAQGAVQALGIACGLWLVHLLPVREYALYTLALSMLTFLSVFSDLGIGSALAYFRRETRIRKEAFEPYVNAALWLRRRLLLIGVAAGGAFMAWSGTSRGFSPGEIAAVGVVLFAAVWLQIDASIGLVLLRFEGGFNRSYRAEIAGNACRMLGIASMFALSATSAVLAVATNALASLVVRLGTRAASTQDAPAPARGRIGPVARYILPGALSAAYFSIQGPMVVWLAATFSGTRTLAEVGALGRLAIIFSLVSGFVGNVLIPRLSVVTDDRHYLRRYLQCAVVLMGFGAAVVGAALVFPTQMLRLVGDTYGGLENGVKIVAISAVLSTFGGFFVAVNNARGWIAAQPYALLLYAATQAALIACLDLSTTTGILYFGLYSNLTGMALQMAINAAGFLGAPGSRRRPS